MEENSLHLKDITLVGFAFGEERYLKYLNWAYSKFQKKISFECIKFFISEDINLSIEFLKFSEREKINIVRLPKGFKSPDYSEFVIKSLNKHINTKFVLNFQHDGFIFNTGAWKDEFLKYDYIGAVWPRVNWGDYLKGSNRVSFFGVGNGGFSLRSKKLLEVLSKEEAIKDSFHPEDFYVCTVHREMLEKKYDIKYAPRHIAEEFSVEMGELTNQFGFHGKWFVSRFL